MPSLKRLVVPAGNSTRKKITSLLLLSSSLSSNKKNYKIVENSATRNFSFRTKTITRDEQQDLGEIKLKVASEFRASPEDASDAFVEYAHQKNRFYGPRSWYKPDVYPEQVYVPLWVFQYGDACGYKVKTRITIDPRKQRELLTNLFGEIEEVIPEKDPLILTANPEDFSQRDVHQKQKNQKKILKELKLEDESRLKELADIMKTILKNQFQIQDHTFKIETLTSSEITISCIIDHIKLDEHVEPTKLLGTETMVDDYATIYASTSFERRYINRIAYKIDKKYLTDPTYISKINYKLKWYQNLWDDIKSWFKRSSFKRDYSVDYYTVDWETSWSLALDNTVPHKLQESMKQIISKTITSTEERTLFDSPTIQLSNFNIEKTDFKLHKKEMIYIPVYVKQDVLNFPHTLKLFSPFHIRHKVRNLSHGEHTFHSFTNGIDTSYVTGYVPYSFPKLFLSYFTGVYSGWGIISSLFPFIDIYSSLIYGFFFSLFAAFGASTETYYKPLLHKEHHKKFAVHVHNKYISNKPLQKIYSNAWKYCANPSDGNTALAIEISKGCDLYSLLELDAQKFSLYTQEEIRSQYKKASILNSLNLTVSACYDLPS
ncbi:predicted protein [Naegleria gruberi]|uniref:Predicted protein n=1 Tax=Naegleria gruberi TaxID=5762 RepID=D2V1R8_NAEGR|nr:uncharacterized protein NAEGRDRAFT_45945 [Naegleria gruberi]EFC49358.1 predicted protein [Naegleria gruberi]|eukprot:XP_002682102.1 predicted protein [Naegleria gruberi strain NEG-M]